MTISAELGKISGNISSLSESLWPRLTRAGLFSTAFFAFAFCYSFVGFLHAQPVSSIPEWTYSSFTIEVLGHFAFGAIVALPFLDYEIILISGASSVLIDSDHFLDAMKLDVSGRPDHSILFAIVSVAFLIVLAKRMNFPMASVVKLAFLGPIIVMNHISYDILAARSASTFPLLIPFNYQEIILSYSDWYTLLFGAIMISAIGYLCAKQILAKERSTAQKIKSAKTTPVIQKSKSIL